MHSPDQVPKLYSDRYNFAHKPRNIFAGMLTCFDEGLGNITAALERKKVWSQTLFVFTNVRWSKWPLSLKIVYRASNFIFDRYSMLLCTYRTMGELLQHVVGLLDHKISHCEEASVQVTAWCLKRSLLVAQAHESVLTCAPCA